MWISLSVVVLLALAPQEVLKHDQGDGHVVGMALDAGGGWLIASVGQGPLGTKRRPVAIAYRSGENGAWEYHSALEARVPKTRARSVAVHGKTAVVGIPGPGDLTGRAIVFEFDGEAWAYKQELAPSSSLQTSWPSAFGRSAAVGGDMIVVGSPTSVGGGAHAFERHDDTWQEVGLPTSGSDVAWERPWRPRKASSSLA